MNDLLLYLARKKSDYKFGIPQAMIKAGSKPQVASGRSQAEFLMVYSSSENTQSEEIINFLYNVVEKGLKRKASEQQYLEISDSEGNEVVDLKKKFKNDFKYIIVFGEGLQSKLVSGQAVKIITGPVKDVMNDKTLKKKLWENIRGL